MTKRRYKAEMDRGQLSLLPPSLEDYVASDNPVRAIDAYVATLDLEALGFRHTAPVFGAGQPPYDPAGLLKLHLYGYMNRVRSSRQLERETCRNLEVIWLLGGLSPSYKTIAGFRKDNGGALKAVSRDFVLLCRELELFGRETVAIDGSFFQANAGKGSIYTDKKLQRQLADIEQKIAEYMSALDENDRLDDESGIKSLHSDEALKDKIAALKARQREKRALREALEDSGETQLSLSDADARLVSKRGQTLAGYNVQHVVDAKHKLIAASEVTNDGNDQHQLHAMAEAAKDALGVDELTVLADTGYYDGDELKRCEEAGITAYVPEPNKSAAVKAAGRFGRDAFAYDETRNAYRCPGGQWLEQQGGPFEKNGKMWFRYASRAAACRDCLRKAECLGEKTKLRQINRFEHEDVLERHRRRMAGARDRMRMRAALAEHPFGTLKCRAGWRHFLVRGFDKVGGELALMVTGYNFTRVLNIIGLDMFMAFCAGRNQIEAIAA